MHELRIPMWLKRPAGLSPDTAAIKTLLRKNALHTVCEEARCPNICECFSRKTATFLILGDTCTRDCRFCSVKTGIPFAGPAKFAEETASIVQVVSELGLKHVVVTSVTRDDLPDGGASVFADIISAIKENSPWTSVEVLVPDFQGDESAIRTVVEATPQVFNHNLETVSRLYREVRPQANFERSLSVLKMAKCFNENIYTKTGIMLGLGETPDDVFELMKAAHDAKVDIFTAGQYMRPTLSNIQVKEYLSLECFSMYREMALSVGFKTVEVAPLVRSSYQAGDSFAKNTL